MATSTLVTADQLLRMPDDGFRYELVAGELKRMTPAGWKHGMVGGQLFALLCQHIRQHDLGAIFLAETGFLLAREPDTVRAPDIAFLRKDRLEGKQPEEAFWPGAPDLAVEVVSPGDIKVLTQGDELSGENVVPGFRCPVRSLFVPQ